MLAIWIIQMILLGLSSLSSQQGVNLKELEFKNFIVWGPGLRADFFMPVRYFYIQTVDNELNNVSYSCGKHLLNVEITTNKTRELVRARVEILDLNDGSYLVRYRLYNSYENLMISIKNNENEHISKSPYILNGNIYSELCYCPETEIEKWYESMECNNHYTQIDQDIKKFENKSIDMNAIGEIIVKKYYQRYTHSFCNYVILNNRIFKKCYGEYVDFSSFSDEMLASITRKVKLPDLDFFMNLGDWPLNNRKDKFLPIVSWCGSNQANDMLLPTYDLSESSLEMMSRTTLDIFSVRANAGLKWEEKIGKGFWRGRDSRQERLDLVLLSKQNPNLIDAALTNMFFFRDEESMEKYGPTVNRTSFFDFFKYKYQLNIDGTVAAYRFPYLLAGDSLIFKQDSNFYEHFYIDLKPNVHYVPIKRDLSDLAEKLEWAIENDENVQAIVKNAQSYSRLHLTPQHIYCYHVKFLHAYSKLIASRVRVKDGMNEIINNNEYVGAAADKSRCHCRSQSRSESSSSSSTEPKVSNREL